MEQETLILYYQSYYKTFLLFALSYTHDLASAEDLVSNAYMKAIISFKEGNFKAWMYKVIRNEYYNSYHRNKRILYQDEQEMVNYQAVDNVVEEYVIGEKKRWLFRQILQLPNKQKQVMLLSAFQDINDEQIGQILNITNENVRVIKSRTRKKLMKRYEEEWL